MCESTPTQNETPTYIYKLVSYTTPPPHPLPLALPISAIDQSSGFIHLSTARQVPNTLKFFFGADPRVYVLRLAYAAVAPRIRWEDPQATVCGPRGGEGMFPHLYTEGLRFGSGEVESVRVLERGGDAEAGWEAAIEADEEFRKWFVY
ncbi:hypothetical protein BU15DRAFT_48983 [Melanogaster broomeanus]|nr:hypothetical protein BU15DRAFT_48983 [Melanogaster broomeanus]